jgi:hypothetical protein
MIVELEMKEAETLNTLIEVLGEDKSIKRIFFKGRDESTLCSFNALAMFDVCNFVIPSFYMSITVYSYPTATWS